MENYGIAVPHVKRWDHDDAMVALVANMTQKPGIENGVDRLTVVACPLLIPSYSRTVIPVA